MNLSPDLLNATVKKITASHGADGDRATESLGDSYPCRFREITFTTEQQNNLQLQSDGQMWVDVAAGFDRNDLAEITPTGGSAQRFRIQRAVQARGASATVSFVKCDLERYHG